MKNWIYVFGTMLALSGCAKLQPNSANQAAATTAAQDPVLSSAKDLTAFSIAGQTGTIGASTIDVTVPFGTNVTALMATFTTTGTSVNISGVNQVSGTTANNFTTAKIYTVVAADASTKNYTVTVTIATNNAKDVTAFTILGQAGTIGTNTINVTVPFGTNVTALVATFTITGASVNISGVNQVSGTTANNFATAQSYTVVAADASTKSYTVTVTVAANGAKDITAFSLIGQVGTIGTNTINIIVPNGTDVTALVANFTTSGASVNISGVNQVSGATPNNFSTARTYTVVAADATTKNYIVTVTVAANISWSSVTSSSDGTKLAAGVGGGNIYISSDSGVTWTSRASLGTWYSVASSGDGVNFVAGYYNSSLFTSADGGVTWIARESARKWVGVCSSDNGVKLAAVVNTGQIFTSVDSGVNWTARESNRAWSSIASSSDGTKLVAAVYSGQIYTSIDSGVTWTARDTGRSWRWLTSSADGTKLAAIDESGLIYTSTNSGVTWTGQTGSGNRAWWAIAGSSDGSKLVAVVLGGQIYTSADSGITWIARESNRNWRAVASSADGTKLVAAVTPGQIYTSTDSGATWVLRY